MQNVMQQVTLIPDGPAVSRLIAGVWRMADWQMTAAARHAWINACLEQGINSFDHADIYGNQTCETLFGEALSIEPALRDRLLLISKCGIRLAGQSPDRFTPPAHIKHYDTSRGHIDRSVENSLRRLCTDHLDILLLHRPDPLMDADEIAEAFTMLRASGKVRWFGVSNHSPSQLALLQSRLSFPLVTNQIEISPAHVAPFTSGVLAQCQQLRMRPMAWSPLAGGRLRQNTAVADALLDVGEQCGLSLEQAALAWLLAHPAGIVPIVGTGNPERMAHLAAATTARLGREQWFQIYRASLGADVP